MEGGIPENPGKNPQRTGENQQTKLTYNARSGPILKCKHFIYNILWNFHPCDSVCIPSDINPTYGASHFSYSVVKIMQISTILIHSSFPENSEKGKKERELK